MGRLWCAGCPTVTPAISALERKTVTVIYPYYENRAFFGAQLVRWASYPDPLRQHVRWIVVDDGSPEHAALDVWKRLAPLTGHLPVRLFRIEVDVRWNWLAARNIGAHHAATAWILLTDMDHVIPPETAWNVVTGAHDPAVVYAFQRREHTGELATPHSATFLMTRALFWTIGGYDEALSGHYGTDGDFRRRLSRHARIHLLADHVIRHERQGDSSTVLYLRKQPEDAGAKRLILARRPGWKPRALSFPYHEEPLARASRVRP